MRALSATDEVLQRLNTVIDPELDQSVTALGFIQDTEIDRNNYARVSFRLPTYWCAAPFAFLMAQDIRYQIESIPWVGVSIERKILGENAAHLYGIDIETKRQELADTQR